MPRTIKKYANRRLYDTDASRHVTLVGIREMVVAGEDVVVTEDTTGQDITRNVLMQVVCEQEQSGHPLLSTGILRQLIRLRGHPREEALTASLERGIEAFLRGDV